MKINYIGVLLSALLCFDAWAKLSVETLSDQALDDRAEIKVLIKKMKRSSLMSKVISQLETSEQEFVILTFSDDIYFKVNPGRRFYDGTFISSFESERFTPLNNLDKMSLAKEKIEKLHALKGKNIIAIYQSANPDFMKLKIAYNTISKDIFAQECFHAAQHAYYVLHRKEYFLTVGDRTIPAPTTMKLFEVEAELATLLSVKPSSKLEKGIRALDGVSELLAEFKGRRAKNKTKIIDLDKVANSIWEYMEDYFGYSVEGLENYTQQPAKKLEVENFEFLRSL